MKTYLKYYLGVIRDTYDELVEAKMEKKRAERDALKQKLIIIIIVLIVITSGNVWFIWYRWQSSREQERDQRMIYFYSGEARVNKQ